MVFMSADNPANVNIELKKRFSNNYNISIVILKAFRERNKALEFIDKVEEIVKEMEKQIINKKK